RWRAAGGAGWRTVCCVVGGKVGGHLSGGWRAGWRGVWATASYLVVGQLPGELSGGWQAVWRAVWPAASCLVDGELWSTASYMRCLGGAAGVGAGVQINRRSVGELSPPRGTPRANVLAEISW